MIVGQDSGDVPVSWGQWLEYVCAAVGLQPKTRRLSSKLSEGQQKRKFGAVTHHRCGHRDVEKLPSPALRYRPGEEKFVSVLGKDRRFILEKKKKKLYAVCPSTCLRGFCACCCLPVWDSTQGANTVSYFFNKVTLNGRKAVFSITYLSVQPALTLVLVFLQRRVKLSQLQEMFYSLNISQWFCGACHEAYQRAFPEIWIDS